ncbi:MAG: type II toxin-antitoxin system mRNA interferase toxin, RelE/StbE family [Candidatus Aegiribacteria sp.]|nr:type II toxin-antitoxin system mRNA interferase toxin, RelE/StbE family [Candidatus Aegiribacteria sp.]MBD3295256.1 type II toxin-antitoxin system mRNA interferase toxin, RelE/StbE family [Candidatus Fermentibacteria bacterium]
MQSVVRITGINNVAHMRYNRHERGVSEESLDHMFRDHKLIGNYTGRRECHVKSYWLTIYKIKGDRLIFERIGSHAELFSNSMGPPLLKRPTP